MKLLGRNILQRGGKKSDDGNDGNAATNGNNGNGNNSGVNGSGNATRNSSSSDANANGNGKRRKKKDKESKNALRRPRQQHGETTHHRNGRGHGHGQGHPSANAHHYQGQGSMNGSSILSIPTGEYDDSTIDANTLYEWSIADNAPSIGSAADIFMSQKSLNNVNMHNHEHQHQQEHDYGDNASICSTGSEDEHDDDANKKVRQLPNDDDDDDDDLRNNDGMAMHSQFQYCKLTDSPPSKHKANQMASVDGSTTKGVKLKNKLSMFGHRIKGASSSVADKEKEIGSISSEPGPNNVGTCTPTRGGISYTRPQRHQTENLPSPSKIKPKTQRLPIVPLQIPLPMSMSVSMPLSAPIPLQAARRISCPVDVDSFLPEDPNDDNYSNGSPLPAELKGRIHAMCFEDDDNDDELNSTFESGASDGTGISAKGSLDNVGDANSPFRRYRAMILQGHEKGIGEGSQTLVTKVDEMGGMKANNNLNISRQSQAGAGLSGSMGGNASSVTASNTAAASNTHVPITHQMPGNSLSQSYPLTKASSLSYFSSTRNLGDMNSPHNVAAMGTHREGMIQKSVSMEPSFTFSINSTRRVSEGDSGDSGESDASGASRWLLNKKSGTRNPIRGSLHAHEDTHNIPSNGYMSSDSDANGWDEDSASSSVIDARESYSIASSSSAAATAGVGAGAGDNKDVSINSSSGSTATGSKNNGKRLRKNLKNQVRNKFHSIVKKKSKDRDRAGNSQTSDVNGSTCSSALEKPRFGKRQSSISSMAPLTGIENYARPKAVIGKRRDTDLAKEVARRKATERREIERKQVEKQHRVEMARLQKQRLQDAKRWKAETLAFSHSHRRHGYGHGNAQRSIRTDDGRMGTIDALESRDRLKNRKKLHDWVMGGFNGNGAHNGSSSIVEPTHSNTSVMNLSIMSDGTSANKSAYTQETNVVDNTTAGSRARARERAEGSKQRGIVTKAFNAFEPNFLDEESDIDNDSSTAALTPEAVAPSTDAVHDFSCVLCKKSERTHLAVPCMHFSFCGECVSDLERKHEAANACINVDGSEKNTQMRCLVCNETVTSFSKVFY